MLLGNYVNYEFNNVQDKYIIFCDASIKKHNNIHYACSGAVCANINTKPAVHTIYGGGTNNRGELLAIYKALELGRGVCMIYGYKPLLIISDSQFGVCGLRDWVPAWIDRRVGETLYTSDNKPVKNQDLFKAILNFVKINNLEVYVRHISGHVNINNIKDIRKACAVYHKINRENGVTVDTIIKYCKYNNDIDAVTRTALEYTDLSNTPINDTSKIVMCDYLVDTDWKGLIK